MLALYGIVKKKISTTDKTPNFKSYQTVTIFFPCETFGCLVICEIRFRKDDFLPFIQYELYCYII